MCEHCRSWWPPINMGGGQCTRHAAQVIRSPGLSNPIGERSLLTVAPILFQTDRLTYDTFQTFGCRKPVVLGGESLGERWSTGPTVPSYDGNTRRRSSLLLHGAFFSPAIPPFSPSSSEADCSEKLSVGRVPCRPTLIFFMPATVHVVGLQDV